MTETISENPNRYFGSLVLAVFGAYWLVLWSMASFGFSRPLLGGIGAASGGLCAMSLFRFFRSRRATTFARAPSVRRRERVWFGVVVVGEVAAIYFLTKELAERGHQEWIASALVLIVGLHFFPLARIFRYPGYTFAGMALVTIGVVLPPIVGPGSPVLMLCSGLVLWATAVAILTRRSRTSAV